MGGVRCVVRGVEVGVGGVEGCGKQWSVVAGVRCVVGRVEGCGRGKGCGVRGGGEFGRGGVWVGQVRHFL